MNDDEQISMLIDQTISGAIATIPMHLQEIEQNKETLKVENSKEFVYGIIMGMALGMGSAMLSAIKNDVPSAEDQLKIRDMIYKKIPQIREQIFK